MEGDVSVEWGEVGGRNPQEEVSKAGGNHGGWYS